MEPKPIPWEDIKVSCSPPDVVARGEARAQATLQAEEGGASASERYAIDAFVRGIIDAARASNLRDSRIAELEAMLATAKHRLEGLRQHNGKLEARGAQQLHEIDSLTNRLTAERQKRAVLLNDLQETAQQYVPSTSDGRRPQVFQVQRGHVTLWGRDEDLKMFHNNWRTLNGGIDRAMTRIAELEVQNRELAEARVTADVEAQQLRARVTELEALLGPAFDESGRVVQEGRRIGTVALARDAIVRLQDAALRGGMSHVVRDPDVTMLHHALDRLAAAEVKLTQETLRADALHTRHANAQAEIEGLKNDVRAAEQSAEVHRKEHDYFFRQCRDVRRLLDPINGRPKLTLLELGAAIAAQISQAREAVRKAADALAERRDVA